MSKRDPATDIPRRIYQSTIDRIDKHLKDKSKPMATNKKKMVKGNFNEFLITMLDFYEEMKKTEVFYVCDHHMFKDAGEASGEAILHATKTKQALKWPKMVVVMGEDKP